MKNIKECYFVGQIIGKENGNTFKTKVLSPETFLYQEDIDFNSTQNGVEVINTWEESYIYANDIVYICDHSLERFYEIDIVYTFHTGDIVATDEKHLKKCEERYDVEG